MSEVQGLEKQRENILAAIGRIGDMRRGSVSEQYFRMDLKGQQEPVRRGPYYVFSYKVQGKTRSRRVRGAEKEKLRREVENFHRYQELSQKLIEINERICELKPMEDQSEGKKKLQAEILQESAREIRNLLKRAIWEMEQARGCDLQAVELGMRQAVHELGAGLMEKLLDADGGGYQGAHLKCACGQQARFVGYRGKKILTVVGEVSLRRAYYWCSACGRGQIPKDQELDVKGSRLSPGVRAMAARVGSKEAFREGAKDLEQLAGIEIGAKEVERVSKQVGQQMEQLRGQEEAAIWSGHYQVHSAPVGRLYVELDGTGIPMLRGETTGRKGKQPDGSSKTREVKIGCVFTQVGINENGFPEREPGSTSYTAAIEGAQDFGRRLYAEAFKRGVESAQEFVVVADGASWIWNLVHEHFPKAIQIVDLYHARQHLYDLQSLVSKKTLENCLQLLEEGKIEKLIQVLRKVESKDPPDTQKIRQEIGYFHNHAHRMRYSEFRRQGLFIGSGVVEAACKNVIAHRFKKSGMFWSLEGANHILQLRTTELSGYWEDFWETRLPS